MVEYEAQIFEAVSHARSGCGVNDTQDRLVNMAMTELIRNSLIHGVLKIERSESFQNISSEALAKHVQENCLGEADLPKISFNIEATKDYLRIRVMDGGGMSPELLEQNLASIKKREDKLDSLSVKNNEGTLSIEEQAEFQSIIESPSGRGLAIIKNLFQEVTGLYGGIEVTRRYAA